jgi:amidohydrolase
VSRKANPLIPSVLSFGKIEGGFATNVIPEEVKILGTFRTMDETWRAEAHRLIKEITEGICQSYGAKAAIEIPKGYPSLYNDPILTEQASAWAADFLGKEQVVTLDKRMAGEDFSFYTQHMPGCFFRIGTNTNNEKFTAPVHNDRFDIDEQALEIGMSMMAWIAINALNTK